MPKANVNERVTKLSRIIFSRIELKQAHRLTPKMQIAPK